jgi:hypothetical protein
MGLLRDVLVRIGIHQRQPAAGDPNQPRNHAQERRFARAVAPGDQQGLARTNRKPKPREHLAAAADAGEAACLKPHRCPPCRQTAPSVSGIPATQSPTFELFSFV